MGQRPAETTGTILRPSEPTFDICSEWDEAARLEFLLKELKGKRPLLPPGLAMDDEVAAVINCFKARPAPELHHICWPQQHAAQPPASNLNHTKLRATCCTEHFQAQALQPGCCCLPVLVFMPSQRPTLPRWAICSHLQGLLACWPGQHLLHGTHTGARSPESFWQSPMACVCMLAAQTRPA